MKLDERRIIDDFLVVEQPCLGAVFLSYTFDPDHFEHQVLRSILRLRSDPDEDGARFHEEARRALKETPIACVVDASVRAGGRRLPYDLHLVRSRTFHPKVYLVLYENEARLAIGSGNLTKSGLQQNTELFFTRALRYDEPASAWLLTRVDQLLGQCADLAGAAGGQLASVRRTLANRLPAAPAAPKKPDVVFLTSFDGPLIDQLSEALPQGGKLTRLGILAPFFEQDDTSAGDPEVGLSSVLAKLLQLRPSQGARVDVGVPWDDVTLSAPSSGPSSLSEDANGSLWSWRQVEETDAGSIERMDYLVVEGEKASTVSVRGRHGEARRLPRATLQRALAEGRLWRLPSPIVHAPDAILRHLAREIPLQLWLHPSAELDAEGKPRRRPLHAKAVTMTLEHGKSTSTFALIGSANASQGALARAVAQKGNVEAAVLLRLDGEIGLPDLLPSLVAYSLDRVQLVERATIEGPVDLSAWIRDVVHDAASKSLTVAWSDQGPAPLGDWRLDYLDRQLASGHAAPTGETVVEDFVLLPTSAELTLSASGSSWQVPIRVLDLAVLPDAPDLPTLGLRELLAVLGRRISGERIETLVRQRGPAGVTTVLDAVFGEDFGSTDVFKAWWGLAEDLAQAHSIAAFRLRLVGAVGVRAVWRALRDVDPERFSSDEVWVLGCELLRELRKLEIAPGPDEASKRELLQEVLGELESDVTQLIPAADQHPWLADVARFYGVGVVDGRA